MSGNEANTCSDLIEQSLTAAGWEFDREVVMAGQFIISNESLRSMVTPLPPANKQRALVERVDRIDASVRDLQGALTKGTLKTSLLPVAVLREAFAGWI